MDSRRYRDVLECSAGAVRFHKDKFLFQRNRPQHTCGRKYREQERNQVSYNLRCRSVSSVHFDSLCHLHVRTTVSKLRLRWLQGSFISGQAVVIDQMRQRNPFHRSLLTCVEVPINPENDQEVGATQSMHSCWLM